MLAKVNSPIKKDSSIAFLIFVSFE
jgi:hypothetical protein